MAKILLIGASGMLGQRLRETLSEAHEVVCTSRNPSEGELRVELADPEAISAAMRSVAPDWIVNAAAFTAVDLAESSLAAAHDANALGPERLAQAAREHGAKLCHFSTDFVFGKRDGGAPYAEDHPTSPVGVYATTKEEGERRVRHFLPEDHLIVRVAWLFGPGGTNFVSTMLKYGKERPLLRVVDDQLGSPTYTRDAARVTAELLESEVRGTVHVAGKGETSWCGLAAETLRLAGCETPVDPIRTEDWPTPAPRPADSRLANRVLEATVGDSMRPWQESLRSYLEELGALAAGR